MTTAIGLSKLNIALNQMQFYGVFYSSSRANCGSTSDELDSKETLNSKSDSKSNSDSSSEEEGSTK